MPAPISKMTLEVLARAYYGLPLEISRPRYSKSAQSQSLKSCFKNGWITEENRLNEQGLHTLVSELKAEKRRHEKTSK